MSQMSTAEALRSQGLGLAKQRNWPDAEACFRRALEIKPDWHELLHDLARSLHYQGRLDDAIPYYQDAVRRMPQNAEAFNDLGAAFLARGRAEEAANLLRRALELRPEYAGARSNLGVALMHLGRTEEAVAVYRDALHYNPNSPDAHNNLGIALFKLGQSAEAVSSFREAVRRKPDYADAYKNLASVLANQRDHAGAVQAYLEVSRLRPEDADLRNDLGLALAELGRFDEAAASYREALRLRPDFVVAQNNLAVALLKSGDLEGGIAACDEALRLDPASVEAHLNRASAWLLQGDLDRGWAEYEWRWRTKGVKPREMAQPRWDGGPLAGRTILLWCEQGVGDLFQFIRYAPLVRDRGGVVQVEVPRGLVPLLSRTPGIDRLVPTDEAPPAFDVQLPLLSVPGVLHTTLSTIPAQVPYIAPDADLVEHWAERLRVAPGFKVGIVWQGNPQHPADHLRSIPLRFFEPLAKVPGVRLMSLQKVHGTEQLSEAAQDWNVLDLAPELDETTAGFMDTAAVLTQLDLLVSCDTATVHLAGAMGVPAWLALGRAHDWRWLRGRDDSPWYPSLRLFRQRRWGDWAEVFTRMAAALVRRQSSAALRRPLVSDIAPGELLDRISILEIKRARLTDVAKRANVCVELGSLAAARARSLREPPDLAPVVRELRAVNERLWDVEDHIRDCEREGDFGPRFIELARSVYRLNDRRAALKRKINERCGSAIVEEKSYKEY